MQPARRYDSRRTINQFVAPGPLVGTTESFVLETLSTGGMSLRRSARTPSVLDKKGLDLRFVALSVPLPGTQESITALIEIVHREVEGGTERLRARFMEMSFGDRVRLCNYLEQRDAVQQDYEAAAE